MAEPCVECGLELCVRRGLLLKVLPKPMIAGQSDYVALDKQRVGEGSNVTEHAFNS